MSQDVNALDVSDRLVASLNTLLVRLEFPFVLETPLDLTPSLLLGILESLLESRLPIAQPIRDSHTPAAKVQAMKVFLGVLENDVLGLDVGLSDVDPRHLAAGVWEEVVFIGELLCWLGKKTGLLDTEDGVVDDRSPERAAYVHCSKGGGGFERILSPSTRSTLTNSMNSALSVAGMEDDSNTTVLSDVSDLPDALRATTTPIESSSDRMHKQTPRCIHEVEDPSFLAHADDDSYDSEPERVLPETGDALLAPSPSEPSYCHCSEGDMTSSINRPVRAVRYNGWIEEVDNDVELQAFEASRYVSHKTGFHSHLRGNLGSKNRSTAGDNIGTPRLPSQTSRKRLLTRHTSPTQHTIALLNERARLLSELASLNLTR